LMFNATWVNDRFKPQLTMILSPNCGRPDKGACVVTFKPRDIDGRVALLDVKVPIVLGYQDQHKASGITTEVSFDVIQTPDTPLPIQASSDVMTGVVGKVQFDCPKGFVGGSRKLFVSIRGASARVRILDGPQFGFYAFVPVRFVWNFEIVQLLKGHADGCAFFP